MKKVKIDYNTEFDLDLAPLLAVMVKLVPVLLISSAFVQMMVIETELPQIVTQALERQQKEPKAKISVEISSQQGLTVIVEASGKNSQRVIPLKNGAIDYSGLHQALLEVKKANPEIFQLDLIPANNVPYKDIVKVMDEARRARDLSIKFPVYDEKLGANVETNYMFPEIVFVNMTEG